MLLSTRRRIPRPQALLAIAISLVACGTSHAAQWGNLQEMHEYHLAFGLDPAGKAPLRVTPLASNAAGNLFHPGEQPRFTLQLENLSEAPIDGVAHLEVIRYGLKSIPTDQWCPRVERIEVLGRTPVPLSLAAGAWTNLEVSPQVPAIKGGYALILDLGEGQRSYVTSLVRTFTPRDHHPQHPKQSLEHMPPEILERLDVHAIRWGIKYLPSDNAQRQEYYEHVAAELRALHAHKVTVTAELGTGGVGQPMGLGRGHLDDDGFMKDGKQDLAWLPKHDPDMAEFVYQLTAEFGWPKGPITGWMLWNEPWEGRSISGWQADLLRYREIYTAMGDAIFKARDEAGVDVLIGGCDSSSNTWDKLFPEGVENSPLWPKYLDFCSIHYQGMSSPALYRAWNERQHHKGRVKIWDTESWVANTDDRFAGVVATNRAAGYDRSMGTLSRIAISTLSHGRVAKVTVKTDKGSVEQEKLIESRPLAAAYGAVQHMIGERDFERLLFTQSLPWVYQFAGYDGNADDGTVVVTGDIMSLFKGRGLFTSVRSMLEVEAKEQLLAQIAALGDDQAERRTALQAQCDATMRFEGVTMTIDAAGQPFSLYDFYGNPVSPQDGQLVIPLDDRGFFLRADPTVAGSMQRLIAAVEAARIDGLQPVEVIVTDMIRPLDRQPTISLRVTNQLERPIDLALSLELAGCDLSYEPSLRLKPRERRTLEIPVSGAARPDNRYAFTARFDAGENGYAMHREELRVNWISQRTATIDGSLDEWEGALPLTIQAGEDGPSFEEQMWLPFANFGDGTPKGAATGFVAYDDSHFYFAAKIADATPNGGAPRFAERDDDAFFYPEVSYSMDPGKTTAVSVVSPRSASNGPLSPGSNDRHPQAWRSLGARYGIELDLPEDRLTAVTLYVVGDRYKATVRNRASGKIMGKPKSSPYARKGATLRVVASGAIRIGLEQQRGKPKDRGVYAIFVDPAEGPATGVSLDAMSWTENPGPAWAGRLGSTGRWFAGSEAELGGVAVRFDDTKTVTEHRWPEGVRRFSYRRSPAIPSGYRGKTWDSVLLGFNAIAYEDEPQWLTHQPGTMPKFVKYKDIDYEFALNPVAEAYGGGTEVFCLQTPAMPRKHFYPRQPKHADEGAVDDAQLAVVWKDGTRFMECAIPWTRIPHVRQRLDENKPLQFSFKVLHDDGGPEMELATGRSVAEGIGTGFHPDWNASAPAEISFGWEP